MRKFLLKSAFLLIIFIMMNMVLFQWLTKPILFNDYTRHKHFNIGRYHKVLFSDSRGEPLTKEDLDKIGVYNFSLGSDNYQDILFRIIYLHSHYPDVDTILLALDKHMLSPYRENLNNNNRSVFYLDGNTSSKYIPYSKLEILARQAYFYFPFLDTKNAELYYLALKARVDAFLSLPPPVTPVNEWYELSPEERNKLSKGRIALQFPYGAKSVKLEKELYNIINYCKENNLALIGINFPLTRTYIKLQDQIKYDPEDIFKREGLPVLDFSRSMLDQEKLFLNADHLNEEGSKPFCIMLGKRL